MGVFSWIGDVVNAVGEFLVDPIGFRNIGRGIPQTFALDHTVNVDGKIDASVRVSGKVEIEATIRSPDLVQSARLIRDGLVKFDLTGGALQQVVNAYAESLRQRQMLAELATSVRDGHVDDPKSEFLLSLSLVNDSTRVASGPSEETVKYQVTKLCRCQLTVEFNGTKILDNSLLAIAATPQGVTLDSPSRKDLDFKLPAPKTDNVIRVAVSPFGDLEELKPCRLQVRVIRKTPNWSYTLYEHIFDGESGPTDTSVHIYVNHPNHIARPKRDSSKSTALATSLNALKSTLLAPADGLEIKSVAELASALIKISSSRATVTEKVSQTITGYEDPGSDAFDVRVPFYLVLLNNGVNRLIASAHVENTTNAPLFDPIELGGHDQIAVKIPFEADFNSENAPVTRRVKIFLQSQSTSAPTFFSAVVKAGYPWASRDVVYASGFIGKKPLDIPVVLWDHLAVDVPS